MIAALSGPQPTQSGTERGRTGALRERFEEAFGVADPDGGDDERFPGTMPR